jgi:hypothetical protein
MSMRAKQEDEDVVLCPSRKFHVRALTSEQAAERFASRPLPEPVTLFASAFCILSLVCFVFLPVHRRLQCFLCGEAMSSDAGIVITLQDRNM